MAGLPRASRAYGGCFDFQFSKVGSVRFTESPQVYLGGPLMCIVPAILYAHVGTALLPATGSLLFQNLDRAIFIPERNENPLWMYRERRISDPPGTNTSSESEEQKYPESIYSLTTPRVK